MHLLSEGRESYLEFLRNLGPQVFLMVVALLAGVKLMPTCCYPENFKISAIVFSFWLTWLLATAANAFNFIKKFTDSIDELQALKNMPGITIAKRIKILAFSKPFILIELLLVLAIIEICLVAVTYTAINSATSLINALHINI